MLSIRTKSLPKTWRHLSQRNSRNKKRTKRIVSKVRDHLLCFFNFLKTHSLPSLSLSPSPSPCPLPSFSLDNHGRWLSLFVAIVELWKKLPPLHVPSVLFCTLATLCVRQKIHIFVDASAELPFNVTVYV